MHLLYDDRALADSGCDALDGLRAHVSDRKHARDGRLEVRAGHDEADRPVAASA